MRVTELERQAIQAYKSLGIPRFLTLAELIGQVEADRGTCIVIKAVGGLNAGQLTGLWMSMPGIDLILHADTGSSIHREQIILHELAHMVLGHEKLMDDPAHLASLLPDLSPERVTRVLARCDHEDEHEIVAEALADLFAEAIARKRQDRRAEPLKFEDIFG